MEGWYDNRSDHSSLKFSISCDNIRPNFFIVTLSNDILQYSNNNQYKPEREGPQPNT